MGQVLKNYTFQRSFSIQFNNSLQTQHLGLFKLIVMQCVIVKINYDESAPDNAPISIFGQGSCVFYDDILVTAEVLLGSFEWRVLLFINLFSSWEAVRAYFKSAQFSEKDMEDQFFIKDRRNTSYERMPHKCSICTLGYLKDSDLKRHNDLNHHKVSDVLLAVLIFLLYKDDYFSAICLKKKQILIIFVLSRYIFNGPKVLQPSVFLLLKKTEQACSRFTMYFEKKILNLFQEGASYKCSHCNKRTPSFEALEQHWRTHSVVYRCKNCGDACKENFMRKHLDHAHTKIYDCSVCHMKFG